MQQRIALIIKGAIDNGGLGGFCSGETPLLMV